MKKFKFTLQTVHKVREMKQEREQFNLMQMQKEADHISEMIEGLEKVRICAIDNYTIRLRTGEAMNISEIQIEANHIIALDQRIREMQQSLELKKQECMGQKKNLAAATREVKITDKLRENQKSRHQLEMARNEQIALDEIISANYARRMV